MFDVIFQDAHHHVVELNDRGNKYIYKSGTESTFYPQGKAEKEIFLIQAGHKSGGKNWPVFIRVKEKKPAVNVHYDADIQYVAPETGTNYYVKGSVWFTRITDEIAYGTFTGTGGLGKIDGTFRVGLKK